MAGEYLLYAVLVIAGLGSTLLVAGSIMAFLRRRSVSYFLVTLALVMLVLRSLLGAVMVGDLIPADVHHFLEHVSDVVVIGSLLMAVIKARHNKLEVPNTGEYSNHDD